jgi:hypothetical protein
VTKRKSQSDVLIERLERADLKVWQDDTSFPFAISPHITPGVDPAEIAWLACSFRIEVSKRVHGMLTTDLAGAVIFPRVTDPAISSRPDRITHKRSEKCYFVKRNIPFAVWKSASPEARLDLFADNLRDSVRAIPARHLSLPDKAMLLGAIDEARHVLRERKRSGDTAFPAPVISVE